MFDERSVAIGSLDHHYTRSHDIFFLVLIPTILQYLFVVGRCVAGHHANNIWYNFFPWVPSKPHVVLCRKIELHIVW